MDEDITRVAVIGGGYMGGGIAQTFALADLPCFVADIDHETARAAVKRLVTEGEDYEKRGLFPVGSHELLRRNLTPARSVEEAVANVGYVTEAVPERIDLKLPTIRRIGSAVRPGTMIGSNTSAIPIGTLAEALDDRSTFLGVHWMNPAYFVPSVEVIPNPETSGDSLATVEALLRRLGKVPTRVADSAGFVANRLQFALFREAATMVEEGLATPQEIDEVVSNSFGFRLAIFGPFAIADVAGLDVYEASFRSVEAAFGERMSPPTLLKEKVAEGGLGLKAGGGFLALESTATEGVAHYRDRAYHELNALKERLGPAPI